MTANPKPWTSRRKYYRGKLGRVKFSLSLNSTDSVMGPCGGGWAYKFGVMGTRKEICIELTWITLRVSWRKENSNAEA